MFKGLFLIMKFLLVTIIFDVILKEIAKGLKHTSIPVMLFVKKVIIRFGIWHLELFSKGLIYTLVGLVTILNIVYSILKFIGVNFTKGLLHTSRTIGWTVKYWGMNFLIGCFHTGTVLFNTSVFLIYHMVRGTKHTIRTIGIMIIFFTV